MPIAAQHGLQPTRSAAEAGVKRPFPSPLTQLIQNSTRTTHKKALAELVSANALGRGEAQQAAT
ncbi:hypothetical protein [Candidatus Leptofilum sp.]|uniref:hypothetical protein n=1 Tax=Candidatus Leptofilum sp. TaxID=3241576 RepID=UPI003B5A40EF